MRSPVFGPWCDGVVVVKMPGRVGGGRGHINVAPSKITRIIGYKRAMCVRRATNVGDNFPSRTCATINTRVLPAVRRICTVTRVVIGIGRPVTPRCGLVGGKRLLFACFRFTSSGRLALTVVRGNSMYLTCRAMRGTSRSLPLLVPVDRITKQVTARRKTHFLRHPRNNGKVLLNNMPNMGPTGMLVLNNNVIKDGTTRVTTNVKTSMAVTSVGLTHLHCLDRALPGGMGALCTSRLQLGVRLPAMSLIVNSMLVPKSGTPRVVAHSVLGVVRPNAMLMSITVSRKKYFRASRPAARDSPACVMSNVMRCTMTGVPKTMPCASALTLAGTALPCVGTLTKGK